MSAAKGPTRAAPGPARWQVPEVDAAALTLARQVRAAAGGLSASGRSRWAAVLEPLAVPLEDGDLAAVRAAANRVRAAFGVGESVAEDLSAEEGRGLRDATDAALRALDRYEARARREVAGRAGDTLGPEEAGPIRPRKP